MRRLIISLTSILVRQRFRGTISFWIKLNYTEESTKPHIFFSATRAHVGSYTGVGFQASQTIFELFAFPKHYPICNYPKWYVKEEPRDKLIWFWETDGTLGNQPDEYILTNDLPQKTILTEGASTGFSKTSTTSPAKTIRCLPGHHRWMHIALAWDSTPPDSLSGKDSTGRRTFTLCINGQDPKSRTIYGPGECYPPSYKKYPDFINPYNLIRLGERYSWPVWNFSGDFTIDEFTIQLHPSVDKAREFIQEEYQEGRYYKGEGVYTSPLIPVPTVPSGITQKRAIACWTVYYPPGWDKNKRPVELQFFNQNNQSISPVLTDPRGSDFEIPLKGELGYVTKIKYKVFFRGDLNDLNTPLLESPIVDDINILFIKPTPKIIEWGVVERKEAW